MCGIAGLFRTQGPITPEHTGAVQRMLDAQVHRGPDDEGLFEGGQAVLGSRRLAIIDLSPAGHQPMANAAGSLVVTYNGEIYNFPQLRSELLRAGHQLRSLTDTEVLLYGYEEWGIEGLLSRLRGMFAFALLDRRTGADRLVLARDRFGIKPLYYHVDSEHLVFASEVRALMRSGLIPDERNPEALVRFLQLGTVPAPHTTVKSVLSLPAGSYGETDGRGLRLTTYWDLARVFFGDRSSQHAISTEDAETATTVILEASVNLHLISDVPLGVFLSGGVDSTALVALAHRFLESPVTTLTVAFEERAYNETRYARLVAERFATNHREVLLGKRDFVAGLPKIFAAMDQPTVDGVNTYFVSEAARRAGLTVVLSGIGGDEIFLGYDHLRHAGLVAGWTRVLRGMPTWSRPGLSRMLAAAGTWTRRRDSAKLAYLATPSYDNIYLLFRGLFAPRELQELLGIGEREFRALGPALDVDLDGRGSLAGALGFLEFRHYLENQLLRDTDCMSMAHSIETRVPYLDHHLVEYVCSLPVRLRLRGGTNKPLLVGALAADMPRAIARRAKMGFTFPFPEWIRSEADDLEARSLEHTGLCREAVQSVWRSFRAGRTHWSRPWATLVAAAIPNAN